MGRLSVLAASTAANQSLPTLFRFRNKKTRLAESAALGVSCAAIGGQDSWRFKMRSIVSVVCLLAGSMTSFAFAGSAVTGAAVTVTHLDLVHNTATLEIVNNSRKDITAYAISIVAVYSNGREDRSEKMFDYGANLTASGKVLHPGSVAEQQGAWGVLDENPLVRADAKVVAVVYADHTAEASDAEALDRIQFRRSSAALALSKSVEILQRYLADPSSNHPGAAASSEIKKLSKSAPHVSGMDDVYLQGVSEKLDEAPVAAARSNVAERDYVSQYLTELQQRAAQEAIYAQIRRAQ